MKDTYTGGVGIWGQRHYIYLKENKPSMIGAMRLKGNLKSYLREVNDQAEEMLFQLVNQMAKKEGIDEALKKRDQLGWVQKMNSIRNRAEEIILHSLIMP
ncbi:MAG: TnpV protein [Clostridia bacterium]|nr:TnpV protein [Clostridia bacterium]